MNHPFLDLLRESRGTPLVVAHRGDSSRAPENTLDAARLGWEAGAAAWELDVQLTRDGVPIVFHDESLGRTTDVEARFPHDPRRWTGYRVSEFDWAEIQALDAGTWFVETSLPRSASAIGTLAAMPEARRLRYGSGMVRVPTLREALELTRDLNWLVNVELKSFPEGPPGLLECVLGEIATTGTGNRVLLSSFDHREIARIAELTREERSERAACPRGILVWNPLHRPADYLVRTVGAQAYHVSAEALGSESIAYRRRPSAEALHASDISELHQAGIPVLVYTVNDARPDGPARHLGNLGVRGLFTDVPEDLRNLFRSPVG